jgi:hypothetical protein
VLHISPPTPPGPIDALLNAVDFPAVVWEPSISVGKLALHLRFRGFDVIETYNNFLDPNLKLPRDTVGGIVAHPHQVAIADSVVRQGLRLLSNAKPPQLLALLLPTEFDHSAKADLFGSCPALVGQVRLTKQIGALLGWRSWFLWSWQKEGEPWIRYAGW